MEMPETKVPALTAPRKKKMGKNHQGLGAMIASTSNRVLNTMQISRLNL